MNRRQFIAGTIASGTTILAGCTGGNPDEEDTDKTVPKPALDESLLRGWEQDGETWTSTYHEGRFTEAIGHGIQYTNTALSKRVEKETLGRVRNQALAQFFAVRVDFFPGIAHYGTLFENIGETANGEFEQQLQNQDVLEEVRKEGEIESIRTRTGNDVVLTGYSAKYSVNEIRIEDVDIPEVGTRSFVIPEQQLDIQGLLGHWKHDGSVYIAGGVYPNKDFIVRPRTSITGEKHSGIDIVIDVNIDLDSVAHNVRELIRTVH